MLLALMSRLSLRVLILSVAVAVAGCGSGGEPLQGSVELTKSDPLYEGAKIFNQRCSGCHTLDAAGAEGSQSDVHSREYKDGPNFNQRKEQYDQVLYAIRNGGFSSGPMPQNIVVGREAEIVARYVEKYSGTEGGGQAQSGNPGNAPAAGTK